MLLKIRGGHSMKSYAWVSEYGIREIGLSVKV